MWFQFLVPWFNLSVGCVVFSALVVSLKALCPSRPDLRVSGGGMGSWGDAVPLPPSSRLLWWCSAQAPWALCPYLSPQEEHLLGLPLRSGCWHCCFSVPKAHEHLGCMHEPRKYLQTNHRIRPAKHSWRCWVTNHRTAGPGLETKDRSQSWQRNQRFNSWMIFDVWSKRVLERHPLWIAGRRQQLQHSSLGADRESTSSSRNEQQVGSLVTMVTMETSRGPHPSLSPSG